MEPANFEIRAHARRKVIEWFAEVQNLIREWTDWDSKNVKKKEEY